MDQRQQFWTSVDTQHPFYDESNGFSAIARFEESSRLISNFGNIEFDIAEFVEVNSH